MNKIFIAGIISFISCQTQPINPVPVAPTSIALKPPALVVDENGCNQAQEKLVALKCPIATHGKPFSQFCIEMETSGVEVYPKCIATVDNCNQVTNCFRSNHK